MSADGKTINAAFPPSSKLILLTVSAHCLNRILPTAVDPTIFKIGNLMGKYLDDSNLRKKSEKFEIHSF